MTEKEAVRIIERIRDDVPNDWTNDAIMALNMAVSALGKQDKKSPTREATLRRSLTCPCCKNVIDRFMDFRGQKCRVLVPNCWFCGQAIDWSEADYKTNLS